MTAKADSKTLKKRILVSLVAGVGVFLLILGLFFKMRIETIKRTSLRNQAALNQVYSGFDSQTVLQLKKEIRALEAQLVSLFDLFYPQEKGLAIQRDRDFSIAFIRELADINQALKLKALEKRLNALDLGFREKLPSSESEANNLSSQLYGIKEVASLGMDYGVNFKSIAPGDFEELEGAPGIEQGRTRMQFSCPAQALTEFILQLNELVPAISIESLSLNFKDAYVELELILGHTVFSPEAMSIVLPSELSDEEKKYAQTLLKKTAAKEQEFTNIIRSKNLFFTAQTKAGPVKKQTPQAKPEESKQQAVFYYRGKALFKSKEVAVIEDAATQESSFCALGDKLKNYFVTKIEDDRVTLKRADTDEEIVVKKE